MDCSAGAVGSGAAVASEAISLRSEWDEEVERAAGRMMSETRQRSAIGGNEGLIANAWGVGPVLVHGECGIG